MKDRDKLLRYIFLIIVLLVLFLIAFYKYKTPPGNQGMNATDSPFLMETGTLFVTETPSQLPTGGMVQTPILVSQETGTASSVSNPSICSQVWGIATPASLPEWLETPSNSDGLYSDIKYVYLAGELIKHGFINAQDCPNGGLVTPDGASNTCGMEKAFNDVIFWQNRFNQEIITAAQSNQIPAQILKRLFANETQFWPPTEFMPPAYGLGNVTSRGIDPLFKWYPDLYQDTCRDVSPQSQLCMQQYSSLDGNDSAVFRGYFISQNIHAYCPTCPNGIDLVKTGKSVDYFAKLLVANCKDVNESLSLNGLPTEKIAYEDAWRLTLANYTIGEGCVRNSLLDMDETVDFSWESFTQQIDINCNAAQYISYINNITR